METQSGRWAEVSFAASPLEPLPLRRMPGTDPRTDRSTRIEEPSEILHDVRQIHYRADENFNTGIRTLPAEPLVDPHDGFA